MNGWSPKDILGVVPIVGASETDAVVSKEAGLSAGGATIGLRVDMKVSDVTDFTGISAKLQQRSIDSWTDVASANASVTITADGEYSIKLQHDIAADAAVMPLQKQVRVVCTTGAGDAVTFDSIRLLQEL